MYGACVVVVVTCCVPCACVVCGGLVGTGARVVV